MWRAAPHLTARGVPPQLPCPAAAAPQPGSPAPLLVRRQYGQCDAGTQLMKEAMCSLQIAA